MNHKFYIQRCLQLAKNGIGTSRPNPSVGAVVVYKGRIIGEGFTSPYGKNHAEVNAISSVKNKELLSESIIYVTLEPCAHFGKTPPCADLIVEHQIKTVVIGAVDSNNLVAGKGIERLKKAGINVIVGILEKECKEHHKRFFTVQNKKRPYIILKWAETNNGFMAPLTKQELKPVWISNKYSQQLVHKWRSEEQAILVGTNTVIADNPKLNVRSWFGKNPVKIVLDRNLSISNTKHIFKESAQTIVITEEKKERRKNVVFEKINFSKNIAQQICDILQKYEIQSIIIEGGAKTLQAFIDKNIWDEARIFIGRNEFEKGIESPKVKGRIINEISIKTDVLKIYKND